MATFNERETSIYGGQPVECYRFVQGSEVWLYTSADREITLPIGTFTPATTTRSEFSHTPEDSGEKITVTVPATNPVAGLFVGEVPSTPVWFTLYRAHRGDEANALATFVGKITSALFKGSEATLTATSVASAILRGVPVLQMQTPCNHVLFTAECGADPTSCRDSITVTTVDGFEVTSNDFGLRDDQWFRGGRLQTTEGEMRFIADHVGDTITLISPLPGLESLDVVYAYWGCDHLETTCDTKFGRLDNHLGFSRLPGRSPFTGRIDT